MASLGGERQRSPTATSVAGSGGSIVTSSVRGVSQASVTVAGAPSSVSTVSTTPSSRGAVARTRPRRCAPPARS